MKILALLLLIIGISKLLLVITSNRLELKEIVYNIPLLVSIDPLTLQALITADGLISTAGAIVLFYI